MALKRKVAEIATCSICFETTRVQEHCHVYTRSVSNAFKISARTNHLAPSYLVQYAELGFRFHRKEELGKLK